MLFNSYQFLIFFPLVTGMYFLLPARARIFWLLLASCFFYMAFVPVYIFILLLVIIIDYWAAIWIDRSQGKQKKAGLILSIISVCSVLFIFKYFNFFNSNVAEIARLLHLNYPHNLLQIALPIGLSFHTFQSLSYVIEVYKGRQEPERDFWTYALYVMFYPQLVAGPIERPQNLLHQFHQKHDFNYQRVTDGLKLMAWGMFKKVVIADCLAVYVNFVYGDPQHFNGTELMIATVFFAFQIYCDFSGYADIAIGSAQVMGIKLMTNFNRPYMARSIGEFWQRWHISLSTWFKDYVYFPLGGNRGGRLMWWRNLLVTFFISGLWHGANWTYVVWGLLNAAYMILGSIMAPLRQGIIQMTGINRWPSMYQYIQVMLTFALVCFAWIFFRAKDMGDAVFIVNRIVSDGMRLPNQLLGHAGKAEFLAAVMSIAFLLIVHQMQNKGSIRARLAAQPAWVRWTLYYSLIIITVFTVYFQKSGQQPFIYFQF